jgi:cytochrome c-type biogenesis protein
MLNLPLNLSQALSGGHLIALPLALAGGVVAEMNPCCLALYPAAAGSCCSVSEQQTIRRSFGNAVAFVLGIAIAIAALGSIAAYVGRIAEIGTSVKYVIAIIPIFMGIYRLGWVKVPAFNPKPFQPAFGGAFGTGLLLSLVIGPCGTPVLASVLSYAAYKQSFMYGGLLLFLYGLGTGLPLVLVGTTAGGLLKRFDCSRYGRWLDPITGGSLLLLGFWLLWRI